MLDHNARVGKIKDDAAVRQAKNDIAAATASFSFMDFATTKEQKYAATVADDALARAAGQNKKAFELQKALNLAKAIVTLPSAVMQSYDNSGGYPWGIPAAIAMAGIGLANIAAIKNAQYGGGSSPPVAGAAAAGGGVVGDTNSPRSSSINVSIHGDRFSGQDVRQLIDDINAALADGAKLGPGH